MIARAKQHRRPLAQALGLLMAIAVLSVMIAELIHWQRPSDIPALYELYSYLPAAFLAFLLFSASVAVGPERPMSVIVVVVAGGVVLAALEIYILVSADWLELVAPGSWNGHLVVLLIQLPVAVLAASISIAFASFKGNRPPVPLVLVLAVLATFTALAVYFTFSFHDAVFAERPEITGGRWWEFAPYFVRASGWGLLLVATLNPGRQGWRHQLLCFTGGAGLVVFGLATAIDDFQGADPLWFISGQGLTFISMGLIVFALSRAPLRDSLTLTGLLLIALGVYQAIDASRNHVAQSFDGDEFWIWVFLDYVTTPAAFGALLVVLNEAWSARSADEALRAANQPKQKLRGKWIRRSDWAPSRPRA